MSDYIFDCIRNNQYGLIADYIETEPNPKITEGHLWMAMNYDHDDMFELLRNEKIRQDRLEKLKLLDNNV